MFFLPRSLTVTLVKTLLTNFTGTVFVVLFFCLLPIRASAAAFSNVYTFGDSLVDNGNFYNETLDPSFPDDPFPASPPYYQGRFSNGPVWSEALESKLGLPASSGKNYAFGGATTGKKHVEYSPPSEFPGLLTQVGNFRKDNKNADPNALYIISAGANNYDEATLAATDPKKVNKQIDKTVDNVSKAVTKLSKEGAQTVMVTNLPNLANIPGNASSVPNSELDSLRKFTLAHNSALAESLQSLEDSSKPKLANLNVITLDLYSLFADVRANPSQYGFTNTNVTKPCFIPTASSSVCSNPDERLFWDPLHPTAAGHQQIAERAYNNIDQAPEPLTVSGSLAALGLGVWFKRKYARKS
ncbi:MAG: hypothetical protein BRC51_13740 [Cyanobacteria bacterium SW_12_48_29]|nr:MAG: hypothetical protein BRC35_14555 [Cyanobacteria bacterium QH_10_48_56]PSO98972.1 MAG: hypothetical protein BRC48_00690 [Cyanobacteria bacterium QS_9_48_30]PSP01217.1 MAG: hypothetical protein BRC51_13740 [Cyanobacteria bacterium SW_12_48_29]PSP01803.1 MAG: hypothetical protein BRC54_15930 [Cyanobacteria bacterium SW_7_48_12]